MSFCESTSSSRNLASIRSSHLRVWRPWNPTALWNGHLMWNPIQGGWLKSLTFCLIVVMLKEVFFVGSEQKGMDRYMLRRGIEIQSPYFSRVNSAAIENIHSISQPSIVCFVGQKTTERPSITVSSIISILRHAGTKQLHTGWALHKDGRWSEIHSSFVYRRIHDSTYS